MNEREPYSPPEAPVRDLRPDHPQPVKGIVMGALTDLGGSIMMGITLSVIMSIRLASQGMSPEEIRATLESLSTTSSLSIFASVLGAGFSVLGGYVCASYAKKDIYGCAVIMAVVVVVAGFLLGGGRDSILFDFLMVTITVVAIVFGAWLYGRKHPEHDRDYRKGDDAAT